MANMSLSVFTLVRKTNPN
uniref:Uncharacterized protein n=1 Tax=Bracon brevicornis TaxID=1563983 RepID=A0A6V7L9R7_9HYME